MTSSPRAEFGDGPVTFKVEEYTGGTLDWFHCDLSDGPDLGQGNAPAARSILDLILPARVGFAGMASDRLFGFEDAKAHLGGIEAGRTDLARLAVVEFSLAYSVDWFVVPLVLPVGRVTALHKLRLLETFGQTVDIRPSRAAARPGWTMFQSTPLTDASQLADMFVQAPTDGGGRALSRRDGEPRLGRRADRVRPLVRRAGGARARR